MEGYVYILTNPSFREDWIKIGKSSRPVDVRSKELDNTAVPLPFEIYATLRTTKYHEAEQMVHRQIDRLTNLRIRSNREFFNVKPETALEIFKDIARLLDDAVIDTPNMECPPIISHVKHKSDKEDTRDGKDHTPIMQQNTNRKTPAPAFKFSMIGIKIGEKVTFAPDGTEFNVVSDNRIEYDGMVTSLSMFTKSYFERKNGKKREFNGTMYFTYRGRKLSDIRNEKENEQ